MPGPTNQQSPEERSPVGALSGLAGALRPEVASILDQALSGADISAEEATTLFECSGAEYNALVWARRRTAPPHRGRCRHLRSQPEHQLHQRLHQAVRFLRLQPRLSGGGRLFPSSVRDSPPGEGSLGRRRNRGLHPGWPSTADGRRHLHPSLRSHQVGVAPTYTSTGSLRKRCSTDRSGHGAPSGNTWKD